MARYFQTVLIVLCLLAGGPSYAQQVIIEPADKEEALAPQVAVSPPTITARIDGKPAGGAIKLYNLGKKPVTINTSIHNWILDEKNEIQVIAPTPESMDLWTIVNPVDFTIPPGRQQTVRFSIRPKSRPSPGEHRAVVFFSQPPKSVEGEAAINVQFRVGVVIYGLSGEVTRAGEVNDISLELTNDAIDLAFDITSSGNGGVRMDGQYTLWRKEGFPEPQEPLTYIVRGDGRNVPPEVLASDILPKIPILQGTRRVVHVLIPYPGSSGEHILYVHGALGSTTFTKSIPLTIPEPE